MGTVKHTAMNVFGYALYKGVVEAIVTTVAIKCTFYIVLVAKLGIVPGRSPQDPTLIGMGATGAVEAICLIVVAGFRVTAKHIRRTVLRLAGAVLR